MTALSVFRDVLAGVAITVEQPPPNVASGELTAQNVVAFMDRAGQDIVRRAEWPNLVRTAELARQNPRTFPGASLYELPTDFRSMSTGGAVWNPETDTIYRPVLNAAQWLALVEAETTDIFFIGRGLLLTNETAETVNMIYNAIGWVQPRGDATTGNETTRIGDNADTFLIPEDLLRDGAIWRWNREKGLEYQNLQEEFDENLLLYYRNARGVPD